MSQPPGALGAAGGRGLIVAARGFRARCSDDSAQSWQSGESLRRQVWRGAIVFPDLTEDAQGSDLSAGERPEDRE